MVSALELSLYQKKRKEAQAFDLLDDFKNKVSIHYSLQSSQQKKLCIAIKFSQMDGVIDTKRHMTKRTASSICINDICDIIDEKINAYKYGCSIIDWIRIDDLPNNPLDIETVRTVPANTLDGTFFEVKENDILVARLGPTILNQKIVMIREIKRTTLASSEFLVLRCKNGYNPEAVMAILKTGYYRNLMYANARGSTPSRYRLSREDALALPFPDIRAYQNELAKESFSIRNEVISLRNAAIRGWETAKERFEKELLREK